MTYDPVKIVQQLGKLGYIIEQDEEESSLISPISPPHNIVVPVATTMVPEATTIVPATTTIVSVQRPEFFIKFWSRND